MDSSLNAKAAAKTVFAASLFEADLPQDWTLGIMNDVLNGTEYGLSEPGEEDGDTLIVGMRDLVNGVVNLEDLAAIESDGNDWSSLRLRKGDILLNRTNSPDLVGKVGFVREDTDAVFASYLVRLHVDTSCANPEYVAYWLNSGAAQRALKRLSTRGVSQANINPTEFRKHCPVPLPSLLEQRKIAEILRTWDEAIEKLATLLAAKKRRSDFAAQRMLAPSRTIGDSPPKSNWHLSSFGKVFVERKDLNTTLGSEDVVTVGKYAIKKQIEHFTRSVASKDLSRYWVISPGDFVYDPMSAYYGAIGRYLSSSDGIVSPAYRVITLRNGISPDFITHLINTHHIRFLLETRSSQGNKEGKRRLLQRSEFETISFRLPPLEVQQQISHVLADFRTDIIASEKHLNALQRQKRGLMQKLLTGEWRVNGEIVDD